MGTKAHVRSAAAASALLLLALQLLLGPGSPTPLAAGPATPNGGEGEGPPPGEAGAGPDDGGVIELPPLPVAGARPNFVVVLTDDQPRGTMWVMPNTTTRVFDQGATFTRAYITTPLCCPSRVSLLAGQYASAHQTRTNTDPMVAQDTVARRLHDAGYLTAHVGKFVNSWDGTPRPEYDEWFSFAGGETQYFNARINDNGAWRTDPGYTTDLFFERGVAFIDQAVAEGRPFALFLWTNAPHGFATPDPQDRALYANLTPYRPPSLDEEDVSDKPQWVQRLARPTAAQLDDMDGLRLRQLQVLTSVDRWMGRLLDTLDAHGLTNDTAVLFLSDNGILTGEHRLIGKTVVYEEASRVVFGMRYPPLTRPGTIEHRLVANIDVAPTMLELAGLPVPDHVDGRSLVALLEGTDAWRDHLYLEGWPRLWVPWQAVHTGSFVYVETKDDRAELYDLALDPFQLENVADEPASAGRRAAMEALLAPYQARFGRP